MNQKVKTKLHFDQLLLLLEKMILQTSIPEKKDFYYLLEEISSNTILPGRTTNEGDFVKHIVKL